MNESGGITPVLPINTGSQGSGMGYGGFGDGLWLFAILALLGLGNNGFFGGGFGGNQGLGYRFATAEDVNNGFNFSELQSENRDILAAISSDTASTIAAVERVGGALNSEIHDVEMSLANLGAAQQKCCCDTLRAIDGVNYNNAMNTAAINANTTAQTQRILDAITANKMEELQSKIQSLELANQLQNVVRYPNGYTYNAGPSPFCQCGCGCGCGNI